MTSEWLKKELQRKTDNLVRAKRYREELISRANSEGVEIPSEEPEIIGDARYWFVPEVVGLYFYNEWLIDNMEKEIPKLKRRLEKAIDHERITNRLNDSRSLLDSLEEYEKNFNKYGR